MWPIILLALLCWVLVLSLTAFALFGLDKRKARRGQYRVPEKILFLSAILGGSPGAILGMRFFHHKTLHKRFRYGLPAILALQVLLCLYLLIWQAGGAASVCPLHLQR